LDATPVAVTVSLTSVTLPTTDPRLSNSAVCLSARQPVALWLAPVADGRVVVALTGVDAAGNAGESQLRVLGVWVTTSQLSHFESRCLCARLLEPQAPSLPFDAVG
jgi:hypothetical protein